MRHRWLTVAALGAVLIGCASAPSRPEVVDPSSDPSAWIPPGEGELAVADRPVSEKPKPKPRARHLLQPNHREMENRLVQAKSGRPRS